MKFYSIGKTAFIAILKMNKNINKTMQNLTLFCRKTNGKEESTREKVLFIPLSNIGVITCSRLRLTPKTWSGNIFPGITEFYMLFWSKWKKQTWLDTQIEWRKLLLVCSIMKSCSILSLWFFIKRQMWMTHHRFWSYLIIWSFSFQQLIKRIEWFLQHSITTIFLGVSNLFSKVHIVTVWVKLCFCSTIILTFFHKNSDMRYQCSSWGNYFSDFSFIGRLMWELSFTICFTFESIDRQNIRTRA